jgi:hypothetical protein
VNKIISLFKMCRFAFLSKKKFAEEQPLRAELFSVEQFRAHAKYLALKHQVSYVKGRDKLLLRLKDNEEVLSGANELLNESGKGKIRISPAGEWLLDNYHLIEEQIQLARKFLPKSYIRELPHLLTGPLEGYPRVYEIAMELVSHCDGLLDVRTLTEFIESYQTINHLKLGELWAIPIMLRLALIENLRRVSSRLIVSQKERDKADYWANRILAVSEKDSNGVLLEIAAMDKERLALSGFFVAEFMRRLHGQSPSLNFPFVWLEKKLEGQGETLGRVIRSVSQKHAADQVSIANTIGSLRLLNITNWHDFVEGLSVVEKILRQDPTDDYGKMAFVTRDQYRHLVEKLSLRSKLTESEFAVQAIAMAQAAKERHGCNCAAAHVGYYFFDKGLELLCRHLKLRLPFISIYKLRN